MKSAEITPQRHVHRPEFLVCQPRPRLPTYNPNRNRNVIVESRQKEGRKRRSHEEPKVMDFKATILSDLSLAPSVLHSPSRVLPRIPTAVVESQLFPPAYPYSQFQPITISPSCVKRPRIF
ncbi:uncharacterized protein BP01DRAFT_140376 [Aspergillus saccharolyticus JOP 1030-1]|uniref:Uncharacterized protein n=1 Tax=Aspergillus saccharolyticus JOP 1030-1 TaxID=1450539 RepID=A0A318ZBJ2_9EURO|nr:hypothetical protein BP01DRAFT_140376 [Aspergillus saccharolyticus JOP 1030-1]PYH42073.1 hypothetical protein BP01DRAFT_140376 [Aspergillus saccharolyticus JOP 1030-1]